jgi:uncharacterized protein YyaL (SSP411 family)
MDGMSKTKNQSQHTNKLINELSPYLLQHANNPVEWHPWGEEAFEKARNENKLVLVSIGYAACHWCHVMEKESFSDPEVADIMNKHYVCIKVDREERPDIDSIYMDAVQLLTGHGGWPLNCFTLPDGRPIFGGTYYKPSQWKELLTRLYDIFRDEPEKLEEQAGEIVNGIKKIHITEDVKSIVPFQEQDLKELVQTIKKQFDEENGGLKGSPKFPLPALYQFLLKYQFHTRDKKILEHILITLRKMKSGGLYDHLGGGFSRYTTDEQWLIPHFEKMLYDNALLASLYSQVYLHTKEEHLKETLTETLDFMAEELMSEENLFYSSIDADSKDGEGAYYTWSQEEINFIFSSNSIIISDYFGISGEPHLNGKYVLHISKNIPELAEKYNMDEEKVRDTIQKGKQYLLTKRDKREKPAIDKKIITSWNALAIQAFINGYKATGKGKYLRIALNSAENIIGQQLQSDYRLKRIYINNQSSVNAFLDDYAYLVETLLELYQLTFDAKWADWAYKITEFSLRNFSENQKNLLNYIANPDKQLISNKTEVIDSVLPSANSVFAKNLFILGQLFYTDFYIERARKMISAVKNTLKRNPIFFYNWLNLMVWHVYPPYEVSIVGRKSEEYRKRFEKLYHPGIILAGGTHEGNLPILKDRFKLGKTQIYICRGRVCDKPINNVEEAIQKIV